jgi:hypothetical protein
VEVISGCIVKRLRNTITSKNMDHRIPSIEECVRKWVEGMLRTPPIPCPRSGRRTRAEWQCQWCGAIWNDMVWSNME